MDRLWPEARRVRVAIVSECFLPAVNGVTNSVRRIVEHLTRSGHDVLIVAAVSLRPSAGREHDPSGR